MAVASMSALTAASRLASRQPFASTPTQFRISSTSCLAPRSWGAKPHQMRWALPVSADNSRRTRSGAQVAQRCRRPRPSSIRVTIFMRTLLVQDGCPTADNDQDARDWGTEEERNAIRVLDAVRGHGQKEDNHGIPLVLQG